MNTRIFAVVVSVVVMVATIGICMPRSKSQDREQVKSAVVKILKANGGEMDVRQIGQELANTGHNMGKLARVAQLMAELESEGQVASTKVSAWGSSNLLYSAR